MNRQAKLKKIKKLIIVNIASLSLVSTILLTSLGIEKFGKNKEMESILPITDTIITEPVINTPTTNNEYQCRSLEELRKVELPTYTNTYKDADGFKREYLFAQEQDILDISREFSFAIKDYFKSCGATNWTNEDNEQFWPEDIEYMVTAIAYRESTYRTNTINSIGCGGLTGLNKAGILKTLKEQWLVGRIWGDSIPNINCNVEEVDTFNGATCIEYTYYNIGYNLANRFKKDKYFIDTDGEIRCVWNVLDYSTETQNRLIIASHLFGVNNVTDAIFGRKVDSETGKLVSIESYIYSDYVEDVLDKMYELKNTYEQWLGC